MSDPSKEAKAWAGLHAGIVREVPQLRRGRVWCHTCGATMAVDSAACLRGGWPLCCGQTMSIDSPEERAKLRAAGEEPRP